MLLEKILKFETIFLLVWLFCGTDNDKECYEYSKIQTNLLSVVNLMQFTVFCSMQNFAARINQKEKRK